MVKQEVIILEVRDAGTNSLLGIVVKRFGTPSEVGCGLPNKIIFHVYSVHPEIDLIEEIEHVRRWYNVAIELYIKE